MEIVGLTSRAPMMGQLKWPRVDGDRIFNEQKTVVPPYPNKPKIPNPVDCKNLGLRYCLSEYDAACRSFHDDRDLRNKPLKMACKFLAN